MRHRLSTRSYLQQPSLRSAASAVLLLGACLNASAAQADGPPVAAKQPVTETFFGTQVTDPYR